MPSRSRMADLAAAIAETPKAVAVQGRRARAFRDRRRRGRQPPAARRGARRRRARRRQGISQPARQAAADDRGRVGRGAGASGRAQGRRRRSHAPAVPPAARARRRRLYLGVDRLCGRSRDRQAQCRLPPADAAQPRHHARQPDRRLRSQADVSRLPQARRAAAGELRDRLASARLSRRHPEAAGRRVRAGRHRARRAGADGARRHQRHLCAGRRRGGDRGLFRRARLSRDGRPVRRVLRLLRLDAHRSGVPRHRRHHAPRRHVPDRAACRPLRRPHGFRQPRLAQRRGERLARAARGADRAGRDQFRARQQRPPALPRRRSSAARRDRRGSRSPRCSRCRPSSTSSSSTRTSMCFPTRRSSGRWRRASRADRDIVVSTGHAGLLRRPDGGQGRPGREGGLRLHRAVRPARHDRISPRRCAEGRRPARCATRASPRRCKPRRCISASWSPRSAAPTGARSRSRSTCCASRTW